MATLLELALAKIDERLAGPLSPEERVSLLWQKQLLLEDVAAEARRQRQRITRDQVHEWDISRNR